MLSYWISWFEGKGDNETKKVNGINCDGKANGGRQMKNTETNLLNLSENFSLSTSRVVENRVSFFEFFFI